MAQVLALHAPKPVAITLPFRVSDDWRRTYAEEHGAQPAERHTLALELTELPAQLRSAALRVWDEIDGTTQDALPEVAELDVADALANAEAVVAAWEEHLRALGEAQAAAEAHQLAVEMAQREEARRFRVELERWALEHGSDRLRLGVERGYKMAGTYVRERAAAELPARFVLDLGNQAAWRDRPNPSEDALVLEVDAAARLKECGSDAGVTTVWLTLPPSDLFPDLFAGFAPCEAVVVTGYLGRYTAVAPLRADVA